MTGTAKISEHGQPYMEWEQVRTPVELKPVMVPKHLYDAAEAQLKRALASIGGLQDQIANLTLELNTAKARLAGLDRKRPGTPTVWGDVTDAGYGLPE